MLRIIAISLIAFAIIPGYENCSSTHERVFMKESRTLDYIISNWESNEATATQYMSDLRNACGFQNRSTTTFVECIYACNVNDYCAAFAFETNIVCQVCLLIDEGGIHETDLQFMYIDVSIIQSFVQGTYII